MNMTEQWDVMIIGAGAAGLMASIHAAAAGASVLVLDHNGQPGKKILSTGNGRCNFTNTEQGSTYYYSGCPAFVLPAFEYFSARDTIRFFREVLHIHHVERDGYCYPRSLQAAAVRNGLLAACAERRNLILTNVEIQNIQHSCGGFSVSSRDHTWRARTVVLAAGGKAAPKSGSDGSGYRYARQLGHRVTPVYPALVPLICQASWLKQTAGVRARGRVRLFSDGQMLAEDTGEIQMTKYGISGIPVFQVSRFASLSLAAGKKTEAELNFLPDYSEKECVSLLRDAAAHANAAFDLRTRLNGLLNDRLTDMYLSRFSRTDRPERLARRICHTRLPVIGTRDYDMAQVTCGGVDVSQVDSRTMESKRVPGLFFAGEILDVDAVCGGYNLQWAWSSGALSGASAARHAKSAGSDRSGAKKRK
jgi:predicted Rossmann fold flavoprotein